MSITLPPEGGIFTELICRNQLPLTALQAASSRTLLTREGSHRTAGKGEEAGSIALLHWAQTAAIQRSFFCSFALVLLIWPAFLEDFSFQKGSREARWLQKKALSAGPAAGEKSISAL